MIGIVEGSPESDHNGDKKPAFSNQEKVQQMLRDAVKEINGEKPDEIVEMEEMTRECGQ